MSEIGQQMKQLNNVTRSILIVTAILCLLPAAPAAAQVVRDVVTVGSVSGSGIVDVPVYIRDTTGTPLGLDQPPGSRIQSFSIKVDYSPASAVQSISFTRAGITLPLTPTFEVSPSAPGSVSLIDNFQESTNLIPFTPNANPGNVVGHLLVQLSPTATPGTTITLTLDPLLTTLSDDSGSAATQETVANARLSLVNGAIVVAALVPTLGTWALALLAIGLCVIAVRMRM
jgi:hypothetical protein